MSGSPAVAVVVVAAAAASRPESVEGSSPGVGRSIRQYSWWWENCLVSLAPFNFLVNQQVAVFL